jgi:muconate cycloisomerase
VLARLKGRYPIAVMADESLTGPASAFGLAQVAGADVFAIKTEQSGGLRAAQQVAAIADAAHIELYGGTMLEGAVGTIASAHVFSTFRELQWGTELFGPLLLTEEILAAPLEYKDFHLTVPAAPGLGIVLDEDRVRHFRRDRQRVTVGPAA